MLELLRNIMKKSRIQILLTGLLVLFVYKVLFNTSGSLILLVINDAIVVLVFYYLVLKFMN
jgi:hypothetical protein